ncbi:MAG: Hsp20/alpha crystallin family protein [Bacteroidota bacterium]
MSFVRFKAPANYFPHSPFFSNKQVSWPFTNTIGEFTGTESGLSTPAVNVTETAEAFQVHVAAPGLKKENFSLDLDRNLLTISATETVSKESAEPANAEGVTAETNTGETKTTAAETKYLRREFKYSSFERSFKLPQSADTANIEAKYTDGVLLVNIPKKEESRDNGKQKISVS